MNGTEIEPISCPYCGERIDIIIDTSIEQQRYIEDCQVCCRPITVNVQATEECIRVTAQHENEV